MLFKLHMYTLYYCYKAFSILKKITWQSHCLWVSFKGIPVVQKKDTLSLISQLIYDDIAKMFHLTAGNG